MLASAAAPVACGGPYLLFGYSGYQLYGVAQLLQAGHNAARIHHVARAHGQEERILPLGLQILRRCGNHAGVPLGEQLGVELVITVEDGLFVVDLRQASGSRFFQASNMAAICSCWAWASAWAASSAASP